MKTTDFGTSWTPITNGIEPEAWARVVREDPVRRDLLYLGTETGFYVSFDGGAQWTRFQMNLPVTPITDLKVHKADLLASTGGRAFWILDDLSVFRQWTDQTPGTDVRLFTPRDAYRTEAFAGGSGGGAARRTGANPPNGAVIDFWLAKVPEGDVVVDILDDAGRAVRTFSTTKPEATAPPSLDPPPATLTAKAGLNRLVWNVRRSPVVPVPSLFTFGFTQGRHALPGAYQVRLRAGGKTLTAPLTVRMDPRVTTPMADLVTQDTLGARVEAEVNEIHRGVIRLRGVRTQVEDVMNRAKGLDGADAVEKSGKALVERLNGLEDQLVQKRVVDGQTVINFPMRLNEFYLYLRGAIDGSHVGITDGQQARLADLSERWQRQQKALQAALDDEVGAFNTLIRARNIPAVQVRR